MNIKSDKPLKKLKKGDTVWFWYSASYVHSGEFQGWRRVYYYHFDSTGKIRRSLGYASLISSSWLFDRQLMKRIPHGARRGQTMLAPHNDLFRSYEEARARRGAIPKPVKMHHTYQIRKRTKERNNDISRNTGNRC